MWGIVIRIVIGLLLIVHGFAHWNITTAWGAKESARSWLLGDAGMLGTVLWALLGFLLAGIVVFLGWGLWRPLAIGAAAISLITMVLFWDWRMAIGVIVDVGILAALLWVKWPPPELVGS